MNSVDKQTLIDIPELGFIVISKGEIVLEIEPLCNVYSNIDNYKDAWRWKPVLRYMRDYLSHHDDFEGSYFVCIYDAWREYSQFCPKEFRTIVCWHDLSENQKNKYKGQGNANEPRFVHDPDNITVYPVLSRPVLAFGRHKDDTSTLLLPDSEFIVSNGFENYKKRVDSVSPPFNINTQSLLWRGSRNVPRVYTNTYNTHGIQHCHVRDLTTAFSQNNIIDELDASYDVMSVEDMLTYRYLLDIDGMVNAWSGLFWKLYSHSVVFKVQSYYEQWYYDMLIPLVHYIPLNTLFDIPYYLNVCNADLNKTTFIIHQSRSLANSLTYDYAISKYNIH